MILLLILLFACSGNSAKGIYRLSRGIVLVVCNMYYFGQECYHNILGSKVLKPAILLSMFMLSFLLVIASHLNNYVKITSLKKSLEIQYDKMYKYYFHIKF